MFSLCDTDIGLNISLPEIDLELFLDGAEEAAGSIATGAIDWWSDLQEDGKLFLDSTMAVMNEQGGLIDKILAAVNTDDEVTLSVKGAASNVDDFLSELLNKLALNMNFGAGERRRMVEGGEISERGLRFLQQFKHGGRRRLDAYEGDEEVSAGKSEASSHSLTRNTPPPPPPFCRSAFTPSCSRPTTPLASRTPSTSGLTSACNSAPPPQHLLTSFLRAQVLSALRPHHGRH